MILAFVLIFRMCLCSVHTIIVCVIGIAFFLKNTGERSMLHATYACALGVQSTRHMNRQATCLLKS